MNLRKPAVQLCLSAFVALSSLACADGTADDYAREVMGQLVSEYRLPSLSLAIGRDDEVVFADALGYANVEEKRLATPRTRYSMASLAKPITAITLAKLADMGRVELDATVASYLSYPTYGARFTVRELAAHLAGIPHDTPERYGAEFIRPRDHQSPFDALSVFEAHELLFEPGTDFHYSANGYILLSALIERVSKTGFADLLEKSVWPAFGMSETELDISSAGKGREAHYYFAFDEDDGYTEASSDRDRSFLSGAGGFLSTPPDMVKLARAPYSDSFLSEQARRDPTTPTAMRNGEPNPDNYSLGWYVGNMQLGTDTKWITLQHAGMMEGAATAYLLVVPECRQSIAFATNYVPQGFWGLYAAMARILRQSIDETRCTASLPLD